VVQGNHQCVERAMHQNCPICFEFLFESVDPTTVLRCGHTIHTQCVRVSDEPGCPTKAMGCRCRCCCCDALLLHSL
jgi:RING finger/CHY zinc finger protein 1